MPIFFRELRASRLALLIWSGAISFMLAVCVLLYPVMMEAMSEVDDMFAGMEGMDAALNMLGDFLSYFALECAEMLGLGGALFAAITGAGLLAKEERDRTAEFLLTHPIPRARVVTEKLLSLLASIVLMNAAVIAVTGACIAIIDVEADAKTLALIFLSYLLLHIEIAALTLALSAFMRRGALGIGLGLVIGAYFLNLLASLGEELEFLKYVTPFGYANGTYIVSEQAMELPCLLIGLGVTALSVVAAYWRYVKKDIA